MKKITAIEAQKKNPERVNIHLDGEYAFSLSRIVAAWLKVGQTVDDEKITALQAEDEHEKAYQRALHFLSYRPRSLAEVKRNLCRHEVPGKVVEETLERLQRSGLVNDEQFAQAWVENRNSFRPRSRRALSMELRQKGLDEATILSVLEAGADDESLAYEAALRKARRLAGLDWLDFRRKLSEFLGRRGFSYGIIAPVVIKIWNEINAEQARHSIDDEETI